MAATEIDTAFQGGALARKVVRPGGSNAAPPVENPMERAVRLAWPRAGTRLIGLDFQVKAVRCQPCDLAELLETLGEDGLFASLVGPDEAQAVMMWDPAVLASVIEFQTTGALAEAVPKHRRPTRTDAALCADLIDGMLRELEIALKTTPGVSGHHGFGYSTYFAETRPLAMLLDDGPFTKLDIMVEMEGRPGQMTLALPHLRVAPVDAAGRTGATVRASLGRPDETWRTQLRAASVDGPLSLQAVLHRFYMPWSDAAVLQPGQVLPLPITAIAATRLEAGDGALATQGRLGQSGGYRAILLDLDDPSDGAAATLDTDLSDVVTDKAAPQAMPDPPVPLPSETAVPLVERPTGGLTLPDLPDLPDLPAL